MSVTYKTIDGSDWQWAETYVYAAAIVVLRVVDDGDDASQRPVFDNPANYTVLLVHEPANSKSVG